MRLSEAKAGILSIRGTDRSNGNTMRKQTPTVADLESLMALLESKDGMVRQKARRSLVALGAHAAPALAEALNTSKVVQVRWEVAKALGSIHDTDSIPSLVKALDDDDSDVAWGVAEALRKFKKAAWPALLGELLKGDRDHVQLHQRAHHVLLNQKEKGLNDLLSELMGALESGEAPEPAMLAAYKILERLKENP
jgi:HEAT repeat protein